MRKSFFAMLALLTCAAGIGAQVPNDNVLHLTFTGAGTPIESEHTLLESRITFSEDGRQMNFTTNGATATYDISQVSGLSHHSGTPAVSLTTHENPADPGYYYTTFYSGLEAYTIPADVQAFTAELNAAGDMIIVTQITGDVLPQGEAVLMQTTSADPITLQATDASLGTQAVSNVFRGSDVYINRPAGTTYVISTEDNVMAFYQYTDSVIPANEAYMNLPTGASAPHRISWSKSNPGVVTGMEDAAATEQVEKFLKDGQLYIRRCGHVYHIQGVMVK